MTNPYLGAGREGEWNRYPPMTRCGCWHPYLRHNHPRNECSACDRRVFIKKSDA